MPQSTTLGRRNGRLIGGFVGSCPVLELRRRWALAAWAKFILRAMSASTGVFSPPEGSGILWGSMVITADGKSYPYRYGRILTSLFLVDGLR